MTVLPKLFKAVALCAALAPGPGAGLGPAQAAAPAASGNPKQTLTEPAAQADAPGTRPDAAPAAFDLPPPGPHDGRDGLVGTMQTYVARHEDTLPDLAVTFDVGFVELKAANPTVDTWLPGAGTRIVVPSAHLLPAAPHKGIVVNVAEMRIYYFAADGSLHTYPIGIGREGWETPIGTTRIVRKTKNPVWYPPASIRKEKPWLPEAMPSGPDNPLGFRAFYLGWAGYLMHGTNTPYGVGRRASHGCIRLYEADIERLYGHVPVGTPVTAVDQETKAAWIDGQLYVEVHTSTAQALEIETGAPMTVALPPDLVSAVVRVAPDGARVDWDAVQRAGRERRGYPVRVSR